jgi:hypothetical protein
LRPLVLKYERIASWISYMPLAATWSPLDPESA